MSNQSITPIHVIWLLLEDGAGLIREDLLYKNRN
jgi:hypothetical protein